MKTRYFGSAILTTLWLTTSTAGAQSVDNGTTSAGSENGAFALEEITITAQRREENLQKAAIAVSAVSGDELLSAGVTKPDDLARMVPALQVQPVGGTGNNFYLRGVGTQGANAFAENPVAFSVDGVFMGRPNAMTGYFYDLDRVEVLKGPQGTLYGRNATGGAVNVITKKPQLGEFGGNVNLEYGNYDLKRGSGALNAPLGDKMALRVAAQATDRDGYYANGYDDDQSKAARLQFRAEPSDTLSILLSGNYSHQGGMGAGSVLVPDSRLPLAPPISDRVSGAEPASIAALAAAFPTQYASGAFLPPKNDGFVDADFWGVSTNVDVQLPFGTLTLLPSYQHGDSNWLNYRAGFYGLQSEKSRQKSMEVRLASTEEGVVRYVVGAFYFDQDQNASARFIQGATGAQDTQLQLGTTSYAGFGQLTFSLSDALRLVGGVRYTREDKDQVAYIRAITTANPNPTPTLALGDLSFNNVSWKASVEYDVAADSLLYASISTGFKAGGFFASATNNTFEPEKLMAYTLGTKNRLLDNRLQLNAELFYWDYKDQQVTYIGGVQTSPGIYANSGVTANVGQARMYGVELETEYLLTDNDRLNANVQYLNTEYTSFKYANFSANGAPPVLGCPYTNSATVPINAARFFDVDCSGKPAINSPEWVVSLGYDRNFNLPKNYSLTAGIGAKYESERYLNIEYNAEQKQDAYIMSDASLALKAPDDRWSVTAWVNNIEDKEVKNQAVVRPVINVVYNGLRAPRTYGLRAAYKF